MRKASGGRPVNQQLVAAIELEKLSSAQRREASVSRSMTIADLLHIARGCHDYNGGHEGEALRAFHHGIATVVSALQDAVAGPLDTQTEVLRRVGSGFEVETERECCAELVRQLREELVAERRRVSRDQNSPRDYRNDVCSGINRSIERVSACLRRIQSGKPYPNLTSSREENR